MILRMMMMMIMVIMTAMIIIVIMINMVIMIFPRIKTRIRIIINMVNGYHDHPMAKSKDED